MDLISGLPQRLSTCLTLSQREENTGQGDGVHSTRLPAQDSTRLSAWASLKLTMQLRLALNS